MKKFTDYAVRPPADDNSIDWQLFDPSGKPVLDVNRFLHAVGVRGLASGSLRAYAYDLLCALRWIHTTSRCITELTTESLLDFIEYQKSNSAVAASTINRRLAVLQRFFIFLTGRAPASPAWQGGGNVLFRRRGRRASALRVRAAQRLIIPLTDANAATFFNTLRTARDRAVTLLMWIDGLRSREVLNLELGDVDFQNMSVKILGKGRKERMMPLAESTAKVLLQYLACERPARASSKFFVVLKGPRRGRPMTYCGLHRLFRYHRFTSRVLNANPHRFRHTFAANMTRCRVSLAVLAKMMGHSSPQTTMRYIQLNDQEVHQQYAEALKTMTTRGMLNADSSFKKNS